MAFALDQLVAFRGINIQIVGQVVIANHLGEIRLDAFFGLDNNGNARVLVGEILVECQATSQHQRVDPWSPFVMPRSHRTGRLVFVVAEIRTRIGRVVVLKIIARMVILYSVNTMSASFGPICCLIWLYHSISDRALLVR